MAWPHVVPRALSPECGYALPLEDLVRNLLGTAERGIIAVIGEPGSGKTIALGHLAALFPDAIALDTIAGVAATSGILIYTASRPLHIDHLAVFRLAPWGQDEWIEYLLAKHGAACASVMSRVDDRDLARGNPELWSSILDELAADENLADVRAALRRASPRLMRHAPVRLLHQADEIVADISEGIGKSLADRVPPEVIGEIARVADGPLLDRVRLLCAGELQPMAASILHAAGADCRPREEAPDLRGAYLDRVQWKGVDLSGADLTRADLRRADLREARMVGARARRAKLRRALLDGAALERIDARCADLSHARLRHVRAFKARLVGADLERADLEGALLEKANFTRANLTGARLMRCNLAGACFIDAAIAGADFTGADLTRAFLSRLKLREANFAGAIFRCAGLLRCSLSGMRLPGAHFELADLTEASLTGASMPHASFKEASLRRARLADVDLERADLREADLSGANFHMGSSRSGRVGSTIASEGTRTGFYTDEYEEQHFKAPEEIRKANLRGADLRGATIEDVDFYLVDLREALYDGEQAAHFRRCGAILGSRV